MERDRAGTIPHRCSPLLLFVYTARLNRNCGQTSDLQVLWPRIAPPIVILLEHVNVDFKIAGLRLAEMLVNLCDRNFLRHTGLDAVLERAS